MARFAQIPAPMIARFHELSKREVIVVCYLLSALNRTTGQCNPTRASIARATGLHRQHIGKVLAELDHKGWVFEMPDGNFFINPEPPDVTNSVTQDVTKTVTQDVTKTVTQGEPIQLHDVTKTVTQCNQNGYTHNKEYEHMKEQTIEQREDNPADIIPATIDPSDFLQMYVQAFPETHLNIFQQELILSRVTDKVRWEKTIYDWRANNWQQRNVGNMLDYYDKNTEQSNGTNKRSTTNGKRTDADVLAESADFYRNYPEPSGGSDYPA